MKPFNIQCTCGHITAICGVYYTYDYKLFIMSFCNNCHSLVRYTIDIDTVINNCELLPRPPAVQPKEVTEQDVALMREMKIRLDE